MSVDYKKYYKDFMYLNYDMKLDLDRYTDRMKRLMAELERLYFETDDFVSYDAISSELLSVAKIALMNRRITDRDFHLLEEKYELIGG